MSVCLLLFSFIYCLFEVTFFYLIYLNYFLLSSFCMCLNVSHHVYVRSCFKYLPTRGGQHGGTTGEGPGRGVGGNMGEGRGHRQGRTDGCIMHQVHTNLIHFNNDALKIFSFFNHYYLFHTLSKRFFFFLFYIKLIIDNN